jgi:hypothetical protein
MNCFWQFLCLVWTTIGNHVSANAGAYGTASIALGLSVAKNIPPQFPKSVQEWWTWMRDSIQTALPISRANSVPIPPVAPTPLTK